MSEEGKQKTSDDSGPAEFDILLQTARPQSEELISDESEDCKTDIKYSGQEPFQAVHFAKVTFIKQKLKQSKSHCDENGEELEALIEQSHHKPGQDLEEVQLKNPDLGEEVSKIESQSLMHGDTEELFETGGNMPLIGQQSDPEIMKGLGTGRIQPDVSGHKHLESRDIFETGGEQFVESSLCKETSETGGNAEAFLEDVPETESGEDFAGIFCLRSLLKNFWERVSIWWEFSTCRNQLIEAPVQFVVAVIVSLVCFMLSFRLSDDQKDIPICILAVTVFCSINTLSCKRYWLDYRAKKADLSNDQDESIGTHDCASVIRTMCCDCWFCCFGDFDVLPFRRRWNTRRRDNIGANTTFVHEVVDVSKLDPSFCPQIRHVDNEAIYESISPEYCNSSIGKADADVHLPETDAEPKERFDSEQSPRQDVSCRPQNNEGMFPKCPTNAGVFTFEHPGKVSAHPEISQSETSKLKNASPTVFKCEHFGQAVACGCPEMAQKGQTDDTSQCSTDAEPLVCQQCGPSVACVCPELTEKEQTFKYPPQRHPSDDNL